MNGQSAKDRRARERRKMRADLVYLGATSAAFLCLLVSFVLLALDSRHGGLLCGIGVTSLAVCGIYGKWNRMKCPQCGKGWLRPIARREDRLELRADGDYRLKEVSQFYDCDACGYREWIESEHDRISDRWS